MKNNCFESLEFNKIKESISEYCDTFYGKNLALSIVPFKNKDDANIELNKIIEAESIFSFIDGKITSNVHDIIPHLKKLKNSDPLTCKEILDLNTILKVSYNLKESFLSDENKKPCKTIKPLFKGLYKNQNIIDKVSKTIMNENEIADDASKELFKIRKNIKHKENDIKNTLSGFLKSSYLQESIITIRNDRYVIPVKAEYKNNVKGFIHDISSTKETVFIEPISIFDLNNEIQSLKLDEEKEIEKILIDLSCLFTNITQELENDLKLIGQIDFIFAKTKYYIQNDYCIPEITDKKEIILKNAYHPFIEKDKAIKNDIYIGNNFTSLVITGPNTGGKTVTLKTVGLLCLMAISGLPIPADYGSKIYMFDEIYVDIGDAQSIKDSLSTFSSHMTNITYILNNFTDKSLILLDEVGTGTDPIEGASLALSILKYINEKGALCISTTHFQELKDFAITQERFFNACVEFDENLFSPTYKLLMGIPGTSQAFSISEKIGLPKKIINDAKKRLDTSHIKTNELIDEIYKEKKEIENEKNETLIASKNAKELESTYKSKLDELNKKQNDILNDAKEKANDILNDAKEDANNIIKELENTKSLKTANSLRNELNKTINKSTKESNKNYKPINDKDLKVGLNVFIPSLNEEGEIISINNNDITVKIGIINTNFKKTDLTYSKANNKNKKELKSIKKDISLKSISPEINVIGSTVLDACQDIDKYIDTCLLNGLKTITIIHGKGTGVLRQGIHKYLKTNPNVKSFRIGTYGEGDNGVTIVTLK